MVFQAALDVVAAARQGAHRAQREAALVSRINQLMRAGRDIRENAEPAEGIDPLEDRKGLLGNAGTADAMKAVTACDEVASNLMAHAVLHIGNARLIAREVLDPDIGGLIDRFRADFHAMIHQVARDLGLSIDRDRLASSETGQVNAQALPVEVQCKTFVDEPLAREPRTHASAIQQVDRSLLEDTGTDPCEHIVPGLPLQDDGFDAGLMQQGPQQQTCRP